ncbi:MAG: dTDP-4-amino-4,6-dideoxygalactose transaminase, partial [Candidatus Thioglobus sp.]
MPRVPFTCPARTPNEIEYVSAAISSGQITGDGPFTKKAQLLLQEQLYSDSKVLLTTSCTHALEMAAILLDICPGDEVIVPSFTFVSSALAFYMHGAKIVFSDIRADTLNIDESNLENLITERTRAIVIVHYGGVSCEMDELIKIADKYNLDIIEDNAHGLYGKYRDQNLGSFGVAATQSFHGTKNISCGEGGALILNKPSLFDRAEIFREKGTNRAQFIRGQVAKYTWVDKGSSYVMSDILAAILYSQLISADDIQNKRRKVWEAYNKE